MPTTSVRRLALILVATPVMASTALHAQAPSRGPVVADLGFGARALGMGGAFQPDEGDSDAVFVSPALASETGGFAVGWQRFDTESTALSVSAAREWFGGGVFAGVRTLDYAGAGGPGGYAGGVDPLLSEGGMGAAETAVTVGYGREVFGLRAGIAGSYLLQRFGAGNAATLAVDLGVATDVGPGRLHLTARNLGGPTTWGELEVDLPATVAAGWGAYGRPVGPLDLGGAVDVARRADGEWLVGGGLEFGYWPVRGRTFVARIGARTVPEGEASPLTLGGAFWGDDLNLDYAFQAVDGTDGIHRITLGWR